MRQPKRQRSLGPSIKQWQFVGRCVHENQLLSLRLAEQVAAASYAHMQQKMEADLQSLAAYFEEKQSEADRQANCVIVWICWFCCRWSCEVSFDLFQTTCGRAASMFAIWLTGTSAVLSSSKPTRRTTNAILRCRIWQRLCRIFCLRCRKKVASTSYLPESTIIHPDSGVSLEGPNLLQAKPLIFF